MSDHDALLAQLEDDMSPEAAALFTELAAAYLADTRAGRARTVKGLFTTNPTASSSRPAPPQLGIPLTEA